MITRSTYQNSKTLTVKYLQQRGGNYTRGKGKNTPWAILGLADGFYPLAGFRHGWVGSHASPFSEERVPDRSPVDRGASGVATVGICMFPHHARQSTGPHQLYNRICNALEKHMRSGCQTSTESVQFIDYLSEVRRRNSPTAQVSTGSVF